MRRSLAAIGSADIVLVVLDGSQPLTDEDRRVLDEIRGKAGGHGDQQSGPAGKARAAIEHSAGAGCRVLPHRRRSRRPPKGDLVQLVKQGTVAARGEHAWAVNQRHQTALEQAKESLAKGARERSRPACLPSSSPSTSAARSTAWASSSARPIRTISSSGSSMSSASGNKPCSHRGHGEPQRQDL